MLLCTLATLLIFGAMHEHIFLLAINAAAS